MGPTGERRLLEEGAAALGIAVSADQQDSLLAFLALMRKWNRRVNLTAVTDPGEMVARHLLDSISATPCLAGTRVLDLGSGAGLPGVPLAMLQPARTFTLLDSRSKRTAFLAQVKIELGLANVEVVNARAEALAGRSFDTVVVRAFGTLNRICASAAELLAEGGIIVAMKGNLDAAELSGVPDRFAVRDVRSITIPQIDGVRHLVTIARAGT